MAQTSPPQGDPTILSCGCPRWELVKKDVHPETLEETVVEIVRGGDGLPTIFMGIDEETGEYALHKYQVHSDDTSTVAEALAQLFPEISP